MQDGIMTTSWPFSQILYDFFNASALEVMPQIKADIELHLKLDFQAPYVAYALSLSLSGFMLIMCLYQNGPKIYSKFLFYSSQVR